MLNEHQINMLPERIYQRLAKMNTEYLTSIGEVIKKIGELRPTDVHRLQQMYNYGADVHRIVNSLSAMSAKNIAEIYDIFDIVAKENYNFAKPFYKAKGMAFIPFEENESLQKYVKAIAKQTAGQYVNLTQHTAFSVFAKDGKSIAPLFVSNKHKVATSLSDTYTKVIDYAVSKVQLGGESYNKAMRDVIKALASSGIKTVDYASGYSRRLDSAVRQNILWGIKECNQNTADMVGKEFGADGYEISYHSNPRPSHVEMGGRQYAIGRARTINGVHYPSFEKEAEPFLNEPNCLHFKFSILLGISQPAHDKDQLEQFKANDKKTFEFEGKKYTGYEGTQLQRRIENAVKNNKDLHDVAKAAGNKELEREAREKINLLTSKYHQLSKASGLPTKMERMSTFSAKSIDNIRNNGYNRFRKAHNIGSFKALTEPMQKKHVMNIIKEMNIDYKDIEIDIIRNAELIGSGLTGYTFPNGKKVQLYPDAFVNREQLVKTIGHERVHCEQVKIFGDAKSIEEELYYERGPVFSEEYWWSEYVRRTGYGKHGKLG